MDQCFVIAIFIARTELQMAVEEEPNVVFEASKDDVLVTGVAGKNDFIGIDVFLGCRGNVLCLYQPYPQATQHHEADSPQGSRLYQLLGKQKRAPQCDRHIYDPE